MLGLSKIKSFTKKMISFLLASSSGIYFRFGSTRVVILMYHRVIPRDIAAQEFEEPGMFVTPETFEMHLSVLKRMNANVIDIHNIHQALPGRLNVAITFDDGWYDNFKYAFPLLVEYGYPSIIYVVVEQLGKSVPFWSNAILRELQRKDYDEAFLKQLSALVPNIYPTMRNEDAAEVIRYLKNYEDHEITALLSEFPRVFRHTSRLISSDELKYAMENFNVAVGSHTNNHIRLTEKVSSQELESEIKGSRKKLESLISNRVSSFCYPNGNYTAEAEKLVKATYSSAVTTSRGLNEIRSADLTRLKRVALHDDGSNTVMEFKAKLTGVV